MCFRHLKVSILRDVLKSCPTMTPVKGEVERSGALPVAVVTMVIHVRRLMNPITITRAAATVVDAEASKARKPRKKNVYIYERNY